MEKKKKFPFKIGADPEFNIQLQNQRIDAARTIMLLFKDKMTRGVAGLQTEGGELGWDGHSATGEIRPNPSERPEEVVENIRKIFSVFAETTQLFELSTLSNHAPIGGHVHLEIDRKEAENYARMGFIHKKMASFYFPILLGENALNLRLRIRQGYGKISDHRCQHIGGSKYTYEFRPPSAEWLTTPKVAYATLAYLATVFHEIMAHPKKFSKNSDLIFKSEKQGNALHELALSNFGLFSSVLNKRVKEAIKEFEYYKEYADEINYILTPEKVIADKEKAEFNIMKGWKLEKNIPINKRTLLNESLIKKRNAALDLDPLMNLIKLQFNQDNNVSMAVQAIKERIIAMNWKLKKNYFLFGLKKGIKDHIAVSTKNEFYAGKSQIKTIGDCNAIEMSLSRMRARISRKNSDEEFIIIGIPYDKRQENNFKETISLIYDLEKDRLKQEIMNKNDLSHEMDGEIEKIYRNVPINESLITEPRNRGVLEEIIREITEEETENPEDSQDIAQILDDLDDYEDEED